VGATQYFIAICGQGELPKISQNYASFNADALARRDNNPGWLLINRLYKIYRRFI
jgi:hypothetical protein